MVRVQHGGATWHARWLSTSSFPPHTIRLRATFPACSHCRLPRRPTCSQQALSCVIYLDVHNIRLLLPFSQDVQQHALRPSPPSQRLLLAHHHLFVHTIHPRPLPSVPNTASAPPAGVGASKPVNAILGLFIEPLDQIYAQTDALALAGAASAASALVIVCAPPGMVLLAESVARGGSGAAVSQCEFDGKGGGPPWRGARL